MFKMLYSNTRITDLNTSIENINLEIDQTVADLEIEVNMVANVKIAQMMHNGYSNIFTRMGCFKGMFSLQMKEDAKPYQLLSSYVAYALKEPFKKEARKTRI